jgi:predicted Zn-dependent protease
MEPPEQLRYPASQMEHETLFIQHAANAVSGWVELGSLAEAKAELASIPRAHLSDPRVLEARWQLHAAEKDWTAGLPIAEELIVVSPKKPGGWLFRAYALRRVEGGGLPQAWECLVEAWTQFPKEPVFPYNLACYACQMGHLERAKQLLLESLKLGHQSTIKKMALADEDLEPLWDDIPSL